MRKVFAVAFREYKAAVQTKAFIVSIVMMPMLMGLSIGVQLWIKKAEDAGTKKYAVIDRTGQLRSALEVAVVKHNKYEIIDTKTGERDGPEYQVEFIAPSDDSPEAVANQRFEMSQRVQKKDFEGFLDIGPEVFEVRAPDAKEDDRHSIRFQSEKEMERDFSRWATRAINDGVQQQRFKDKGVSQDIVRQIQSRVPLTTKALSKKNPVTGQIEDASEETRIASTVLPIVMIMLMFMMVLIGAMPAMQGVVEEKQQRIAEVLLGSLTPFELMLGKLIGVVAIALTVSGVYLGGAFYVAHRYGFLALLPADLIAWFLLYLILAVFMYGSMFMAVGAAAGDMKETQALQMPIMMVFVLPMMLLGPVLRDPGGPIAIWGSFIPFSAPMLMMARIAGPTGVPWWQAAIAAAGVIATTMICVWGAGRIFRVGLLMQGKGVKFGDLLKWVVSG
jgi:ABC-2 type transport system permease protein